MHRFLFHLFPTDCSIFMSFPRVCWSMYFLKVNAIISGVSLLLFWIVDTFQLKSCINKNSCCTWSFTILLPELNLNIPSLFYMLTHIQRNLTKSSPYILLIAFPLNISKYSMYILHYKKYKTYQNVLGFRIHEVSFLLTETDPCLHYPQLKTFTSEK